MKHLIVAALTCLAALPAPAQVMEDVVKLSIRTGWSEANGTHIAGLQFDLKPGWKTYWRQPGEAGIPPQFNWSGSRNLQDVQVLWPRPKVNMDFGMRSIVYSDQLVLPIVLQPNGKGPIGLKGRLTIGVCEQVCIPVDLSFSVDIQRGGTSDRVLAKAIKAQPVVKKAKAVCRFRPKDGALVMTIDIKTPKLGGDEHVAIEMSDPDLWVGTPKVTRDGAVLTAEVKILSNSGSAPLIDRKGVRSTIISGKKAIEVRGCQAR